MTRRTPLLVALCACSVSILGCGGPGAQKSAEPRRVNAYFWTNYLPDDVIADFESSTGIDLHLDTYDSNEAILAKLQSGVADYDLVVPSDYMVKILVDEKLARPIERTKLTGFEHLDPRFLDQAYDPGNQHSVPYVWGTTGLGYNVEKAGGPVTSWSVLFEAKNAGRILMLDDAREALGIALKRMGKSLNETDPAVLRQAADQLMAQKKLVKTYNSSDFATLLAAGDVDFAHGYNGELAEVVAESQGKLAYVVPEEGGTLWIDSLVIPTSARHPEEAHALINFLLRPEIAARVVNKIRYASANRDAGPLIDPEIREDAAIYPPSTVLDRCETIKDLGATTELIDELWTEIKAQ